MYCTIIRCCCTTTAPVCCIFRIIATSHVPSNWFILFGCLLCNSYVALATVDLILLRADCPVSLPCSACMYIHPMSWPFMFYVQARIVFAVMGLTFITGPLFGKFFTAHVIHNQDKLIAVCIYFIRSSWF